MNSTGHNSCTSDEYKYNNEAKTLKVIEAGNTSTGAWPGHDRGRAQQAALKKVPNATDWQNKAWI